MARGSGSIRNSGFWKQNAPAKYRDMKFTDTRIPKDIYIQVAKKHPNGLQGARSAVQLFINMGSAKGKRMVRLKQIARWLSDEIKEEFEFPDAYRPRNDDEGAAIAYIVDFLRANGIDSMRMRRDGTIVIPAPQMAVNIVAINSTVGMSGFTGYKHVNLTDPDAGNKILDFVKRELAIPANEPGGRR